MVIEKAKEAIGMGKGNDPEPPEDTPEHEAWEEKQTAPDKPVKVEKASAMRTLPLTLQTAINFMDDQKIRRDMRPKEAAKMVRRYFGEMNWPDEGQPETVRQFLEAKGVPIIDTHQSPETIKHLTQDFSNRGYTKKQFQKRGVE